MQLNTKSMGKKFIHQNVDEKVITKNLNKRSEPKNNTDSTSILIIFNKSILKTIRLFLD